MRNHARCNSFLSTTTNFPFRSFASVLVARYVPHNAVGGRSLHKIPYVVFRLLFARKHTKSPAQGTTLIVD
jgi:hypothetical protein